MKHKRFFLLLKSQLHFTNAIFKQKILVSSFLFDKNWPFDPCVECPKVLNFAFACEVKLNMMKELDVEFENEVEHEEFPKA